MKRGGRSGGFFSRVISVITSPVGWIAMILGAFVVALVGGKLKDTIEGVAGKIKPAQK